MRRWTSAARVALRSARSVSGDDLVDEAVPPDAPLLQQAGRDGLLHVAEHPRPVLVEQRHEQLERELAPGDGRVAEHLDGQPRRLSRPWTTSVTHAERLGRRPVDREPPTLPDVADELVDEEGVALWPADACVWLPLRRSSWLAVFCVDLTTPSTAA